MPFALRSCIVTYKPFKFPASYIYLFSGSLGNLKYCIPWLIRICIAFAVIKHNHWLKDFLNSVSIYNKLLNLRMVWGTHKLSVGIRNEDGLLKFIHCAGTDILYNNNDNKQAFRLLEFCETPAENYTLFQSQFIYSK